MNDLNDGSEVKHAVNVSFVRDPLGHFVSGFSEIFHRTQGHPFYKSSLYTFNRVELNAAPHAFIRDFVGGRLHRVHDITDAHCFPQVAFLAGLELGFIGDLDSMDSSWKSLGEHLKLEDWPRFNQGYGSTHVKTDAKSGSPARAAMSSLIGANSTSPAALLLKQNETLHRVAMCRVLLPDFVCFGYEIPTDCISQLGVHGVVCPFKFPRRTSGQ